MAKVGYIMVPTFYDKLEDDRAWMQQYSSVKVFEEKDSDERPRPNCATSP